MSALLHCKKMAFLAFLFITNFQKKWSTGKPAANTTIKSPTSATVIIIICQFVPPRRLRFNLTFRVLISWSRVKSGKHALNLCPHPIWQPQRLFGLPHASRGCQQILVALGNISLFLLWANYCAVVTFFCGSHIPCILALYKSGVAGQEHWKASSKHAKSATSATVMIICR